MTKLMLLMNVVIVGVVVLVKNVKKNLLAVESKDWNRSTSRELTIKLKLSMLLC